LINVELVLQFTQVSHHYCKHCCRARHKSCKSFTSTCTHKFNLCRPTWP